MDETPKATHGRQRVLAWRSFRRRVLGSCAALCLGTVHMHLAHAQVSPGGYSVARFGALFDPGTSAVLRRMNVSREIVGAFKDVSPRRKAQSAFLLTQGGFQYADETDDSSVAHGINNQGEVVGAVNAATAMQPFRSARLRNLQVLPLFPEDTGGAAFAINERGEAVGHTSGAQGVRPVWWSKNGQINLLPSVPGTTLNRALGINDSGDIVGVGGDGEKRAILWQRKGQLIELGTMLGFIGSEAANINNRGEIVGYAIGDALSPMRTRAVRWAPGGRAIQDLGVLPGGDDSRARDINASGVIVGTSSSEHGNRAFVWTAADGIVDLNELIQVSGLVLTDAISINQRGDIVAVGHDKDVSAPGSDHGPGDHEEDHERPLQIVVLTKAP